jgi:hypothetical protein
VLRTKIDLATEDITFTISYNGYIKAIYRKDLVEYTASQPVKISMNRGITQPFDLGMNLGTRLVYRIRANSSK